MSKESKKTRQMVQWASGSKMQRFSRVTDDRAFWRNFEKCKRNDARGVKRNDHIDMIKKGDLCLINGTLQKVGGVDYNTKSVMVGIHRHGFSAVKRVPQWVDGAWILMQAELNDPGFDFKCEIVPVNLMPHPFADHLSIVELFGYSVVVQTAEFKDAKTAAWVLPDSRILSKDPYFDWLGSDKRRVRVRKFRGIKSYGFLIPIDEAFGIGTDVQSIKGICHYKTKDPRNKLNGN